MKYTFNKNRLKLFVKIGLTLLIGGSSAVVFAQTEEPKTKNDLPDTVRTEESGSEAIAEKAIGGISIPKEIKVNSSQTATDVVLLKNGDRLSGKISRSDGKALLIK